MTAVAVEKPAVDKFRAPLYTLAEAARYLDVSGGTFRSWARGYERREGERVIKGGPVLTALGEPGQRGPAIPFVGLAEGYALSAIRRAGVPLQRIRPALDRLEQEFGIHNALASQRLFTDGVEVLYNYAQSIDDGVCPSRHDLVVVRDGQGVFADVVRAYLRRITWGTDGYAVAIPLPGYAQAEVVADVRRGFGQPTFTRGGARVEDALALFYAGESAATVAAEFGLTQIEVEDAIRVDRT
jgi:uncharacterized protein (DUF433 family)